MINQKENQMINIELLKSKAEQLKELQDKMHQNYIESRTRLGAVLNVSISDLGLTTFYKNFRIEESKLKEEIFNLYTGQLAALSQVLRECEIDAKLLDYTIPFTQIEFEFNENKIYEDYAEQRELKVFYFFLSRSSVKTNFKKIVEELKKERQLFNQYDVLTHGGTTNLEYSVRKIKNVLSNFKLINSSGGFTLLFKLVESEINKLHFLQTADFDVEFDKLIKYVEEIAYETLYDSAISKRLLDLDGPKNLDKNMRRIEELRIGFEESRRKRY